MKGNMNDTYLVFNGKRVDISIDILKELGVKDLLDSPFDRVREGEIYYIIGDDNI